MKKIVNYDQNCLFCNEGFIEDASSYDEASGYCLRGSICECATVVDCPVSAEHVQCAEKEGKKLKGVGK